MPRRPRPRSPKLGIYYQVERDSDVPFFFVARMIVEDNTVQGDLEKLWEQQIQVRYLDPVLLRKHGHAAMPLTWKGDVFYGQVWWRTSEVEDKRLLLKLRLAGL